VVLRVTVSTWQAQAGGLPVPDQRKGCQTGEAALYSDLWDVGSQVWEEGLKDAQGVSQSLVSLSPSAGSVTRVVCGGLQDTLASAPQQCQPTLPFSMGQPRGLPCATPSSGTPGWGLSCFSSPSYSNSLFLFPPSLLLKATCAVSISMSG
jgi:hypothetical protein